MTANEGETAPSVIDKGSPAAWRCRRLIEAWVEFDADRLDSALSASRSDLPAVTKYLAVVAAGTINAVALAAKRPFEEVLEDLFMQLAAEDTDTEMAQLTRAVVTAFSDPEPGAAESLNTSGALFGIDTDELLMHLLGMTMMVARHLTDTPGELSYALDGFWGALGTNGEQHG